MEIKTGVTPQKKHWYTKWWGITILVVACLLVASALALGALIFTYMQAVKSGKVPANLNAGNQAVILTDTPEIQKVRLELETADDPTLGNQNAPLVVVEFMDFKCPICKAQASVVQQLISKYGYNVRLIVRDFPMESVNTGAARLAEIASCANEQGGYWLFSDYFFANQDSLGTDISTEALNALVDEFGLDKSKMLNCLSTGRGRTEVSKDYTDGYKNGISRGTPTYFINGRRFDGAIPLDGWEKLLKGIGYIQ